MDSHLASQASRTTNNKLKMQYQMKPRIRCNNAKQIYGSMCHRKYNSPKDNNDYNLIIARRQKRKKEKKERDWTAVPFGTQ